MFPWEMNTSLAWGSQWEYLFILFKSVLVIRDQEEESGFILGLMGFVHINFLCVYMVTPKTWEISW